jgi:hypothetical protein
MRIRQRKNKERIKEKQNGIGSATMNFSVSSVPLSRLGILRTCPCLPPSSIFTPLSHRMRQVRSFAHNIRRLFPHEVSPTSRVGLTTKIPVSLSGVHACRAAVLLPALEGQVHANGPSLTLALGAFVGLPLVLWTYKVCLGSRPERNGS